MNLKYILISLFVNNKQNGPARLQKQSKKSIKQNFDDFVTKNFYLIVLATFVLIWIILALILFTVFNSSVESGAYYYHINEVI